jgi:hypothetical protein
VARPDPRGLVIGDPVFNHLNTEETVMKRLTLKRSLITLGLLTLVGTVGAETYYTHKVAERMETQANQPQAEQPAPVDASKMHTSFDDGVLTVTIPKAAS